MMGLTTQCTRRCRYAASLVISKVRPLVILPTRAIFLRVLAILVLLMTVVFWKAPALRTQERAFTVFIPTRESPDFARGPVVMHRIRDEFFAWQSNQGFTSEFLSFHGQGLGSAWSQIPDSVRQDWLEWAAKGPFPLPEQSREFISHWVQAAGPTLSTSDLSALNLASNKATHGANPMWMSCSPSDLSIENEQSPHFIPKFATLPNFVSALLIIFAISVLSHQRSISIARRAAVEHLDSGPNNSMHSDVAATRRRR